MSRLFNPHIYIIFIAIGFTIGLTFLVSPYIHNREIQASVTPTEVEAGAPISFADSTKRAGKWLWEFGNGESSAEQRGQYTFSQTGRYQIRLTVDGNMEKQFVVNVRAPKRVENQEVIRIEAPKNAIQGEYITFRGVGTAREWRWEFGETGDVDAVEQIAMYKYDQPGQYAVSLRTENTQYPVLHTITITQKYVESAISDDGGGGSATEEDIRKKLQAIADQQPFNTNYNHILSKYLCNNSNTQVVVNNTRRNDFYSYCQGLQLMGRGTRIESVVVEMNESGRCVSRLMVTQTD